MFGFGGRSKKEPAGNDKEFYDGLASLTNSLLNRRKASTANMVKNDRVSYGELREIFRMGVASRIYRLKVGYGLNGTLKFESSDDKKFYEEYLEPEVKRAALFQLGFGRGLLALMPRSDVLDTPRGEALSPENTIIRAFSGDVVGSIATEFDVRHDRYYKPTLYSVRGEAIHWTRCVDFTYYMPTEEELPEYEYGGVSEAELIYEQLINDGVVERASSSIVERNSTLFYMVKGFKNLLQTKQEKPLLEFFARLETMRSLYGAGIVDADDDVKAVAQTLTNLADVNDISLRRLAMVTGIPLPMLIGENVKGLNSSGDTERQSLEDTIGNYAKDYLIRPINILMSKFGRGKVEYIGLQDNSKTQRANQDKVVIDNAVKLASIGGNFEKYLEDYGLVEEDASEQFFKGSPDNLGMSEAFAGALMDLGEGSGSASETPDGHEEEVDPEEKQASSLNGAQVSSLLEVVEQASQGKLSKETAREIILFAYPIDASSVDKMLSHLTDHSALEGDGK